MHWQAISLLAQLLAIHANPAQAVPLSSATVTQPNQVVFRRRAWTFYTFGDSFTDSGYGAWEASNHTWPADPAYYGHAFSNGPRWGELAARKLGAVYVNPASGGATANNSFVRGYTGPFSTIPVPSALEQIDATIRRIGRFSEDDVVSILIGGNDAGFAPNITSALREGVVDNIRAGLDRLHQAGARRLLLVSYPDLAILPSAIQRNDKEHSRILSKYSLELANDLKAISEKPPAGMRYLYLDNHALFRQILADPESYGFDPDTLGRNCLVGVYPIEGQPRSLCEDPDRRLFFDVYHPNARAHEVVAEEASRVIGAL